MTTATTYLRRPDVHARTGLSRSTIYRMIAAGNFPAPRQLGARAVGWLESDIEAWNQSRAAGTRPTPVQAQG